MIRFTERPPRPGTVESTLAFDFHIRDVGPQSAGRFAGSVIMANLETDNDPASARQIAEQFARTTFENYANGETVEEKFLEGVEAALNLWPKGPFTEEG